MRDAFFSFRDSKVHYSVWGGDSPLLICFHGYGESASSFSALAAAMQKDRTVLTIDLPFHGATEWNEGLLLEPRDLLFIIDGILRDISATPGKWSLLGYSMGGRVALHLLQLIPEKIGKLILLAPDGLRVDPWYWVATQTGPGNRLFRYTMAHPKWLFFLLRLGNTLKLVNPGIFKFTLRYIDDELVRHNLYIRWTTMRTFRPDLPLIKKTIRTGNIPVRIIYGRFDRIIRPLRGQRFRKGIEEQCQIQLLQAGHQLLQADNLPVIYAAIIS